MPFRISLYNCALYMLTFVYLNFFKQTSIQISSFSMAMKKMPMYACLLCLTSLFSLSCQQTDSCVTHHCVPLPTPLEETEHSCLNSSNATKDVTDCSKCCAKFSCMYDLIVDGLRASEEFEALGNLLYLSGEEMPVFIPIDVHLTWSQCFQNISGIKEQSYNYSYIWGGNATYAAFGPAQEFFQSAILFDPIMTAVAFMEQWFLPKVPTTKDRLEHWVIEHDQTLTVNVSKQMCVFDSHTVNKPLEDTLNSVTAKALTKVSVIDVP